MTLRTRLFALTYDRQIAKAEEAGLRAFRESLLASATGHVIEIGGGTGANLPFYGPAVESLTITEPQPPMLRRLQRKADSQAPAARVLRAPAEDLPFDDDTFDVAVSTLVLCGVDDQPRALRELRRVLRPGGQLLFIEHVRSDDPGTARLQDRMNWINRPVVCCDCNRPTLSCIQEAGFIATQVEHTALPKAPKFASPAIMGNATAPVFGARPKGPGRPRRRCDGLPGPVPDRHAVPAPPQVEPDRRGGGRRRRADHAPRRPPRKERVMNEHPLAAAIAAAVAGRDSVQLAAAVTDTVDLVESAGEAVADRVLIHYRLDLAQRRARWACTQTSICKIDGGRLATIDLLCSGFREI